MKTLDIERGSLNVSKDAGELVEELAAAFYKLSERAVEERGRFTVALSGGSTPKALYERLSKPDYKTKIQWDKAYFFLGDERCVAHSDPGSNFLMASNALFDKIGPTNLFPTTDQDTNPEAAAANYEATIQKVFELKAGEFPTFDLILLGLGPDGHTASLFPDSKALTEKKRLFVANFVEKFKSYRLTMTFPVINKAREIIFMVSGKGKADILKKVLDANTSQYPSQHVDALSGNLEWFVDQDAASNLNVNAPFGG